MIAMVCLIAMSGVASLMGATWQPETVSEGAPAGSAVDYTGVWQTTFGRLTLRQTGSDVVGEYGLGSEIAKVEGKVKQRRLDFAFKEHDAEGEGWFVLSEDGQSFEGKWRNRGGGSWQGWTGSRAAAPGFEGLWKTTYGPMRLTVAGGWCDGIYEFAGFATIRGEIVDRRLSFTYAQPDGERGTGTFELSADGMSFEGTWKSEKMEKVAAWRGDRLGAKPGVVCLVILEAHWEGSLGDPEYSYGEMQRAFFKRLPNVAVRHRFVHDLADVQRFCGEVAFIAEPVILYFSSHGSEDGIAVGQGTVKPEQIAAALKGAGNIKLLHFGACEVMAGDAPKRLLDAMPGAVRFPISGFANSADWAGSAIIDFTYLDLVLEHGMAPAAAVEEVRKSLRFADRDERGTGVIAPSLLRIYESPVSKPEPIKK